MLKRLLLLGLFVALPVAAQAQSLTEGGWTSLYSATTNTEHQTYVTTAATLHQATITVFSTAGFSTSGTIRILIAGTERVVTYTGITATTFTGGGKVPAMQGSRPTCEPSARRYRRSGLGMCGGMFSWNRHGAAPSRVSAAPPSRARTIAIGIGPPW